MVERVKITDIFKPGDLTSLQASPERHFGFNWHESGPPESDFVTDGALIPPGPQNHLQVPIEVLSLKQSNPNFLRP